MVLPDLIGSTLNAPSAASMVARPLQPAGNTWAHPPVLAHARPVRQPAGSEVQSTVSASDTMGSTTAADPGTITSNDFLTLLVSELKNQDPTSDQDPNAYINQLVGVNSLQQLISINQDLTPTGTSSTSSSTSPATSSATAMAQIQAVSNTADKTVDKADAVAHALTPRQSSRPVSYPASHPVAGAAQLQSPSF